MSASTGHVQNHLSISQTTGRTPGAEEPYNGATVLTISGAHAIHDTYAAFLAPLLPKLIDRLLLSKTEAGLLTVFSQLGSLLQPVIGHLADRKDLRAAVILGPTVTAAMMTLIGLTPGYGLLILLLLVASLSTAGLHAVGPAMAGAAAGSKLGRSMGFWMVGGELGRTLGPLILVTALRYLTMAELPWLMIGGVVASAVIARQLKDLPPAKVNGQAHLPILQRLQAMRSLIGPLAVLLTARAFFVNAMTTFLPVFLTEEGFNFWLAGVSLSVLEAAGVVGALIGGSLSDRLGRRRLLLASTLLAPLFMLAFLVTEGWTHFPLLILVGFTGLSVAPVLMAVVQENYPDDRALANGAYMFLNFGIRSIVVLILGAMSDLLGMRTAFIVSAVAALIGVPSVFWLPQRAKTS